MKLALLAFAATNAAVVLASAYEGEAPAPLRDGTNRGFVPEPGLDLPDQARPIGALEGSSHAGVLKGSSGSSPVELSRKARKKKGKRKKRKGKKAKRKKGKRTKKAKAKAADARGSGEALPPCVPPAGSRANRGDRRCERFCEREDYEAHAFDDGCLCFDLADATNVTDSSDTMVCPTFDDDDDDEVAEE